MSDTWGDDLDQPVAYWLSGDGRGEAGSPTLTFAEAARVAGVTLSAIRHAHCAGRLPTSRRPDGVWVVEWGDAVAYGREAAERRARVAARRAEARDAASPRRVLPAGPLLRQVELRGGPAACGVEQHTAELEALRLAKLYGRLTPRAADQLAAFLGMSVWELWPTCAA